MVPFAAGGATDAIARILTRRLSQTLGQQIVIETVGGAGGMIGAARVARAAPDGYTILLHQVGLAAGMTLYPKPTFDAEKDLIGIGIVNTSASTITGAQDAAAEHHGGAGQLDEGARQHAKIAHAGVGSFGHLCGVLFVQEVGAKADQIPVSRRRTGAQRSGRRPCRPELPVGRGRRAAGQGGNLKAYGIIGKKRFAGLPDVPTMGEAGYKNLDLVSGTSCSRRPARRGRSSTG